MAAADGSQEVLSAVAVKELSDPIKVETLKPVHAFEKTEARA